MTYLTEDEAEQQRCPFFRVAVPLDPSRGWESGVEYVNESCRGSVCKMAWRWFDQKPRHDMEKFEKERQRLLVEDPRRQADYAPTSEERDMTGPQFQLHVLTEIRKQAAALSVLPPRGYCGMAGKPE